MDRGAAEETSGLAEHASPLRERDEIFEQARVQADSDAGSRTLRPDFLESNRADVRKQCEDIDVEFRERLDERAREARKRVEDHEVAEEPVIKKYATASTTYKHCFARSIPLAENVARARARTWRFRFPKRPRSPKPQKNSAQKMSGWLC